MRKIENGHVTISVRGTGIGAPKADQAKLFFLFLRATNVENIQGTKLGLDIDKKYVELISGKISFTSREVEDSTFTIEFPQTEK
jgi:signal transduction histidine kinase